MPGWLEKTLRRIREFAVAGKIRLTEKSVRELGSIELGLDVEDVRDVLMKLEASDSACRLVSEVTGEWMYVFNPSVGNQTVYVKVVLRGECVVVSFHLETGVDHEKDE